MGKPLIPKVWFLKQIIEQVLIEFRECFLMIYFHKQVVIVFPLAAIKV